MTPDSACVTCRERLLEYAANVLPEPDREAVAAHLASCDACRRELEGWRAVQGALVEGDREIPPDDGAVASWSALRGRLAPRSLLTHDTLNDRRDLDRNGLDTRASRRARPTDAQNSERRPYVAVAAVLLIVTLAVAVFSVVGARGGAHNKSAASTPHGAAPACSTSQLHAETPPNSSLRSVSMISATDGWAVGYIWDWQSPTPPATLIMRFHNCVWSPVGQSIPSAWMFNVSMSTDGDGWAVGGTVRYLTHPATGEPNSITTYEADTLQVFVLRFTHGQWRQTPTPVSNMSGVSAKVQMTSTTDGWMLVDGGKSHTDPYTIAKAETVLHYAGGVWTVVPTPFKTPGEVFWDLTTVSAGECWIAAYDTNTSVATVAHYQNGKWQTWNPGSSSDNYAQIMSIGVVNTHDVWVASPYEMFHFDGAAWKQITLPAAPRQTALGVVPEVVMRSATDGWVVAPDAAIVDNKVTGPSALHFDGENWQWETIPEPDMNSVRAMQYVTDTQAWAVGDGATATSAGLVERAKFVYYDHGVWTELPA